MISKSLFGKFADGSQSFLYSIVNKNGMRANIIDYGAIVQSLYVKDKSGNLSDVVLGYDTLEGYVNDGFYIGAIVGRYGNRIAGGKFKLNGAEYNITKNDGSNHLHGGKEGFSKKLWQAEPISENSLKLTYISKDREEGYPGTLILTVIYNVNDNNSLEISYEAKTDKPTILNPTHHSYFNLSGDFTKNALDHELKMYADRFTPVDEKCIPTGELRETAGTPMNFSEAVKVGEHINEDYGQLKIGSGYDHNWVIDGDNGSLRKAAEVYEKTTGRFMEFWTDQPGMQFYTSNFLDDKTIGKKGLPLKYRGALCLEAQHFPDSPNKLQFPSAALEPGETYKQTTLYKFSIK